MAMLNVLINAYGCSPSKGSEGGLGWMWVSHLSKYCKITVITEAQSKKDILSFLPQFEYRNNVEFHFVDIGERARKMCWNQGDWRFYYYYREYQKKVYDVAKILHNEQHFDIVHHLNMICFREPSYLWKLKGCKFVWGPIGGFTELSTSYLSLMPKSAALKNIIKNSIRKFIIRNNGRIKNAFDRADLLMSASYNSYASIKKYYGKDSVLMNETGLEISLTKNNNRDFYAKKLQIVWVGRFIHTKFLDIALRSLSKLSRDVDFEFHILGDGKNRDYYKNIAKELGINEHCVWHGMIPREDVQDILATSHLFFFTSLVEGTSHAVLEAIAHRVPILCFNTCGHGAIVNERMGIKIPVTNPNDSIKRFATIIEELFYDRTKLASYASITPKDVETHTWTAKTKRMISLYELLMSKK